MITCRRAAELISQRLDTDISTGQRLVLNVHLLMCRNCRAFRKQIIQVNDETGEFLRADVPPDDGNDLSADARARIYERLTADTTS